MDQYLIEKEDVKRVYETWIRYAWFIVIFWMSSERATRTASRVKQGYFMQSLKIHIGYKAATGVQIMQLKQSKRAEFNSTLFAVRQINIPFIDECLNANLNAIYVNLRHFGVLKESKKTHVYLSYYCYYYYYYVIDCS